MVGVLQVPVDPAEMRVLPVEGLAGGCVLQHFGDGAQAAAVVGVQGHPGRDVHDVKAIGGHHCRVHEAVVEQVPHDLGHKTGWVFRNRRLVPEEVVAELFCPCMARWDPPRGNSSTENSYHGHFLSGSRKILT